MTVRTVITGANRGLGLEFARQLAARGDRIWAGVRDPEKTSDLLKIAEAHPGAVTTLDLDVSSEQSIRSAVQTLHDQTDGLDLLINNAGIYPRSESLRTLSYAQAEQTFRVNSLGPLFLARETLDLLLNGEGAKIINVSSQMGSLNRGAGGGSYSYRASKAALNMYTRSLAAELRGKGIICIAVHPGWVRTDMGGAGAAISVEESVRGMLKLIFTVRMADSGGFFDWNGRVHPW